MLGRISGAVLLVAVAPVACGEDAEKGIPEAELPAQMAQAFCDAIASCCSSAGIAHDPMTCRDNVAATVRQSITANAGLRVQYDGELALRCKEAIAATAGNCYRDEPNTDLQCWNIWQGLIPHGQSCTESVECAGDLPCSGAYPSVAVCEGIGMGSPIYRVGAGERCNLTCYASPTGGTIRDEDCSGSVYSGPGCLLNDGLMCYNERCTPAPPVGYGCIDYCTPEGWCDRMFGLCRPRVSSGSCADAPCLRENSYCDIETLECLPLKADGAPCDDWDECAAGYCVGGLCGATPRVDAEICAGIY